jgi:2-succinyl-6-hydroxy-2,4-cyclohexadiene-1-carboxylate synthase
LKSNYWRYHEYHLHYYTAGNPAQPCILFLHGFLGSGLDWQDVIKILSNDFYCIAPDLPGHGKTKIDGISDLYTMEYFAPVFVKYLKNTGVFASHLTGYSMGGRFALFLSVHFPDLWQKLILESASPGLKTKKERIARNQNDEQLAKRLEQIPLEDFLKDWYGQSIFNSLQKSVKYPSMISRRMLNNPRELAIALCMMGTGNQPSLWKEWISINGPILLLAGEFDRKFCKIMSAMKKSNANAELQIVKSSGHNIHFEKPSIFHGYIYNFLTGTRERHL